MDVKKVIKTEMKKKYINIIIFIILKFIEIILSFSIPYKIGQVINLLINNINSYHKVLNEIYIIAIIVTFNILITYFNKLNRTNLVNNISFEVTNDILNNIAKAELSFFNKNKPSYLIDRIISDSVATVSFIFDTGIMIIIYLISSIGLILFISNISFKISVIFILAIPIYIIVYLYFKRKLYRINYNLKEENNNFISTLNNQMNAISFIKFNSLYNFMNRNIKSKYNKLYKIIYSSEKLNNKIASLTEGLNKYITVIILFFGLKEVINGQLQIGYFAIISNYSTYILEVTGAFLNISMAYQRFKVSIDRLNELKNIKLAINGNKVINCINKIRLEELEFNYGCNNIINKFYQEFKSDNIYIIKGKNGSGKSTLIKLLCGMENDYRGKILINEYDIKNLNMNLLLKNNISIIEQEPILLSGNLFELIKSINDNVSLDIVEDLMRKFKLNLNLNEFDLNNHNLSGGEKQKIAIILGLIKNGDVMIFDEPTSALDDNSTKEFISILNEIKKDKIIIIVSHEKLLENSLIEGLNAKVISLNFD